MMKWLRRILRLVGFLAVVSVVAGLIWREDLVRLYKVNTLFDEDRIVSNFSNMRESFLTVDIPRGERSVFAFRDMPAALPASFTGPVGKEESEAYLTRSATTSLLVVRRDAIEFEGYYLGTGPDDQRISWSVAKSFLSALVGVALGEGAIKSLDDPVTAYAPLLTGSAYDGSSIRNVLNMASGVEFDEDYLDFNSDINKMGRVLALGGSLDEFSADLTDRVANPGEAWRYVSIDTHVLGMVLRGATGRTVADYMQEKLWSRIGPEGDASYVTDGEGAEFVLGGLNMRTRDYARFGRLILKDGLLDGEFVLPPGWARQSTARTAPAAAEEGVPYGYGFQWWLPPDADDEVFALGVYGQYIWIDRKAGVVIVKTAADRNFRANDSRSRLDAIAFFRAVSRR
jgi:CubicO group peptidase (beta-lactamase class C family)